MSDDEPEGVGPAPWTGAFVFVSGLVLAVLLGLFFSEALTHWNMSFSSFRAILIMLLVMVVTAVGGLLVFACFWVGYRLFRGTQPAYLREFDDETADGPESDDAEQPVAHGHREESAE